VTEADVRAIVLDVVYALPSSLDTLEEHERHTHRDLFRRSRTDLARELDRVRLRLTLEEDPDPWLRERYTKVKRVLDRVR
jgi:hypothetical protein